MKTRMWCSRFTPTWPSSPAPADSSISLDIHKTLHLQPQQDSLLLSPPPHTLQHIELKATYLLHWRRVLPVVPGEKETGAFMGRNGLCEENRKGKSDHASISLSFVIFKFLTVASVQGECHHKVTFNTQNVAWQRQKLKEKTHDASFLSPSSRPQIQTGACMVFVTLCLYLCLYITVFFTKWIIVV